MPKIPDNHVGELQQIEDEISTESLWNSWVLEDCNPQPKHHVREVEIWLLKRQCQNSLCPTQKSQWSILLWWAWLTNIAAHCSCNMYWRNCKIHKHQLQLLPLWHRVPNPVIKHIHTLDHGLWKSRQKLLGIFDTKKGLEMKNQIKFYLHYQ